MKLRGHGNGVSIALAALAVVVATTGTAVAVTATVVNIADPKHPTQVAKVDATGHLFTAAETSSINSFVEPATNVFTNLTSPTTATLALTRFTFNNPATNSAFAHTDFAVGVFSVVTTTANCDSTGQTRALLLEYIVKPGDSIVEDFTGPLLVRPSGSRKYCIEVSFSGFDGNPTSYNSPTISLGAYVVNGSYSGLGASAAQTTQRQLGTIMH